MLCAGEAIVWRGASDAATGVPKHCPQISPSQTPSPVPTLSPQLSPQDAQPLCLGSSSSLLAWALASRATLPHTHLHQR